jgi:thiol-disulfide isomerase/thioredoxin
MSEKIKKELKSWGIYLAAFALLYFTGLHTEVAAFIQRGLLATGIHQAEKLPEQEVSIADYNLPMYYPNGQQVSLDSLRGKVIFLNFWATWCPPCRAEMPSIQALYERLGAQSSQIAFVMLAVNDQSEKVRKYIGRKKFTFPVYEAAGYIPPVFHSSAIPTTFVIDKKGRIVLKHSGMADYDNDEFAQLLTDLAKEQ